MNLRRLSSIALANVVVPSAMFLACGGNAPEPVSPPSPPPTAAATPSAPQRPPEARAETPDAPFRQQAPAPGPEVTFVAPVPSSFTLKNGVRVWLVERHDLPVVALRVILRAGAGEGGARPGAFSIMGAMLEQGNAKRSALEISDAYESLGAQHSTWFDWDAGGGYVKVLAKDLDPAVTLLADNILTPTFAAEELDRLRARRIAAIGQERMSAPAMAQNALAAALYGRAHPYGHSLSGRVEDAKALSRDELIKLHAARKQADRLAIVVAGDVTRATLEPVLERAFGALPKAKREQLATEPTRKGSAVKAKLVFVNLTGATQSTVLLSGLGVSANYPTRDALSVMNAILGGTFGSRINMNLREKHAYTYGARSRFSSRRGVGPFSVGGAMVADHTGDALTELFREIDAMRSADVTDEELQMAKQNLRLGMPGRFETVADVTGQLSDLAVYGLPTDEFATRMARIDAVTKADVRREANALLARAALKCIVVGDRTKVMPQLVEVSKTLGLGDVLELDAYGDAITSTEKVPAKVVPPSPKAP
jgi:zinc protease